MITKMIKENPDNFIKTLYINRIPPPAPFKGGMGQSGNLPKSPFEGGQGGCYNPDNLNNLMKIMVQTKEKAPLNPPFGGVGGGSITINISHLSNGLYFLKIGNKTVKFVKE